MNPRGAYLLVGALEREDVLEVGVRLAQLRQQQQHLVAYDLALLLHELQDPPDGRRLREHCLLRLGACDREQPDEELDAVELDVHVFALDRARHRAQVRRVREEDARVVCGLHTGRVGILLWHLRVHQIGESLERVARHLRVLLAQQRRQHREAALVDQPQRLLGAQLFELSDRVAPVLELRGASEALEQPTARRFLWRRAKEAAE